MYKIFIREHKRKLILVFIGTLLLSFVALNIVNKKYDEFVPEHISDDLVYFEINENSEEDVLKYLNNNNLEYEKTISLFFKDNMPYVGGLDNKISINSLNYTKETSKGLPLINQKLITNKKDPLQGMWALNLNSNLLTDNNFYFKNNIYNIKEVIGSWPQNEDEVLISENIAMSLLTEKEMNKYEDLIGEKIILSNSTICGDECYTKNYTISGIYKRENLGVGNQEYYIINPPNEIKDDILDNSKCGYIVKVNDRRQVNELENNFSFTNFISSKDNEINPEKFLKIVIVIISNMLLIGLLFMDFKKDYLKLRFLGVSKVKCIFSLGYFVIIFNFTMLVLVLII